MRLVSAPYVLSMFLLEEILGDEVEAEVGALDVEQMGAVST